MIQTDGKPTVANVKYVSDENIRKEENRKIYDQINKRNGWSNPKDVKNPKE